MQLLLSARPSLVLPLEQLFKVSYYPPMRGPEILQGRVLTARQDFYEVLLLLIAHRDLKGSLTSSTRSWMCRGALLPKCAA